jgi:hypothetical protein
MPKRSMLKRVRLSSSDLIFGVLEKDSMNIGHILKVKIDQKKTIKNGKSCEYNHNSNACRCFCNIYSACIFCFLLRANKTIG